MLNFKLSVLLCLITISERVVARDLRRMGTVREEDQRSPQLDRQNEDGSRFSTEQEETTEGPARLARKSTCRRTNPED